MISSKEIRQQFIDFFVSKAHTYIPSAPVVPIDDNTLLFTNAGMNQFKNIFLGRKEADVLRAVNSQKCIRAGGKHNDLEEVGKDGYHHTFFEMLGNWSFGDYYKKEAIEWAWELLTEQWGLPKEKLHATVHDTDSEAYLLWKELTDIDHSHITYHGDKDNFWEMGESGPCGPCSEIHLDRGIAFCDKSNDPSHVCAVNGDCHRYIELWNLVFIQYFRDETGKLNPLPNKFVDTGAGLERICQIIQGKSSNYETDLFIPILQKIASLSHVPYSEEVGVSHRVIADHIRTLCFALADGGFPSNEGRGYVLRRILRRAARHGRLLGFLEPFLWKLVDTVTDIMGHHYQELNGKSAYIKMVIKAEEERFNQTLDKGLDIFEGIVKNLSSSVISGKDAFMLYDTYGFPLDLTAILAEEKGLSIDQAGFDQEMEMQRSRARAASKFSLEIDAQEWIELSPSTATDFVGYEHTAYPCSIQRYAIAPDGTISIQLDKTPFYAEQGGQVSDIGRIHSGDLLIEIEQVKKVEDHYIHIGKLKSGVIACALVIAEIDNERRDNIARNHSATHILHKALRSILGDHVQQKGSLVSPDYLRFDFTHIQALTLSQIHQIEALVNTHVLKNHVVNTSVTSLEQARSDGATALFGEKYGDQVRVVKMGEYSSELCGGTHVSATGSIGSFKIISESSSAAGIRRIEAITGNAVLAHLYALEENLAAIAAKLSCPLPQVLSKVDSILEKISLLEKEKESNQLKALSSGIDSILQSATEHEGISLINQLVEISDPEALRQMGDLIKEKASNTIAVLFAISADKISILCVVTKDISGFGSRFHAGKIVGKIAELVDGKGGGRPDSAMAGGKNLAALDNAMQQVKQIVFGS